MKKTCSFYFNTIIYVFIIFIILSVFLLYVKLNTNYFKEKFNNNLNKYELSNQIIGKFELNTSCPLNYKTIVNSNECKIALNNINPKYQWKGNAEFFDRPYGCILHKDKYGYFNTKTEAINGQNMIGDDKSVCKNNITICPTKCSNGCKPVRNRGPYGALSKCSCPTTCIMGVNIM